MPDATPESSARPATAPQNQALQQKNRQLLAHQATAAAQPLQQEQYAQSQARFRTVFENSPLGQKIITPDLTIRQVNAAVVAMLGYTSPDELIGRRILEFAHPQFRADWHHLQAHLHSGDSWVESREREGTCFFIELPGGRIQPTD